MVFRDVAMMGGIAAVARRDGSLVDASATTANTT
jgi:hypothetical protein